MPGHARGKMLMDLATLFEEHADILASIESIGTPPVLLSNHGSVS